FLAALFSKEFAILFIPMWVLQVFLLRDRTHRTAQKNLLIGYALGLLAVVFIFLLFRQFAFERSLAGAAALSSLPTKLHSPLSLRLDLAAKALGRYFLLLIVPYPLKITYEASSLSGEIYPTTTALSYGAIALWIAAFSAAAIRRSKKFTHALLWLPLSISIYPLLIILPWKSNINLFAERFLSLGVVGWALLVALLIEHLWPLAAQRSRAFKSAVIVIALAYLAIFLALDIKMSRVWHDDLLFASYLAKHSPESATAHNNLAVAYAKKGAFNEAIGEFEATLKITQNFKTYIGLGMMHNELGDWKEAIDAINQGLRRYPQGDNPAPLGQAYLGQAKAHENLGNTTQARQAYQAALNIAPGLPMAADALKRLQTPAEKQK
ncbi:MAG: tetratricopeptide repeat protein, partial [bacterium]